MRKWPDDDDVRLLTGILLEFHPNYTKNIRSKRKSKSIPTIYAFLSNADHYCETSYCSEF